MTAAQSIRKATPQATPDGFTPTPKHPSRAVAGLLLAAHRHEAFEVLGSSGRVRVPSASEPHLKYIVNAETGTCSCPGYLYGRGYTKGFCKHVVAVDLVLAFRDAAPGASFGVFERHDSRFGTFFDVIEFVPEGFEVLDWGVGPDWQAATVVAHEREVSTALSFEGALWEVLELMQGRISEGVG